ncbi:hypothetical protein RFI_11805 [Reticulomyxa filosa]|uniref:Uncharacterized protein n=1 Tax=Reticulomyxa filosa TaxID=46433 RepID=X6NG79_RETFI|nr:hypothetical protein RFI_11805 [Reticulomyxa filosa]|eukprot:ETO25335.1 hypothetical protein RFI_11805 [Reticulomyxa filosa]
MILNDFIDYSILLRMYFGTDSFSNTAAAKVLWIDEEYEVTDGKLGTDTQSKYFFTGLFDRNGKLKRFVVNQVARNEVLTYRKYTFIYFSWRLSLLEHGNYVLMDRVQNTLSQHRVIVILRSGPVIYPYASLQAAEKQFEATPVYQTVVLMYNDKILKKRNDQNLCWSIAVGNVLVELIDNFYSEELYKGKNLQKYSLATVMKIA